jgi:hypothetical protein
MSFATVPTNAAMPGSGFTLMVVGVGTGAEEVEEIDGAV